MKRLLTLVAFFATLHASAQQVNPVPDYVFRNQMSVGRNAVTDTAAYFSIGPRYGATKGLMPPIVGDTATFSSGKRNGLLIFSVQKNKFLYWDSVRVQWSDMAGSSGSYIVAGDTSAMLAPYLRKADTTAMLSPYYRSATASAALALKLNISDTSSMLTPYIRHAGYGLTKSGQSFLVDTLNIATRAWRQKGLDSLAALEVSGSGTTNYVPKFTAGSTIGNSQIFDNGTNVGIGTASPAVKLDVSQASTGSVVRFQGDAALLRYLEFKSVDVGAFTGAGWDRNVNSASGFHSWSTAGVERLRIFANGRVFIGASPTDAGYQLDINGTLRSVNGANFATTSGNVGIGTASPTQLLELSRANNASSIGLFIKNSVGSSTNNSADIWFGNYDGASTSNIYNARISALNTDGNFAKTALTFYTYNGSGSSAGIAERMRITSDGELIINTTSDAGDYKLQVSGNIYNTGSAVLAATSGGVAIGTTNTGYGKLGVYDATNSLIGIGNSTSYSQLQQNGADLYINNNLSGAAGGNIVFRRGAGVTESGRINSAGEWIIDASGTDAGDYKLQVVGNARVGTGKLDIASNTTFGIGVSRSGTSEVAGQIYNSNGILYLGAESSAGGQIFSGSSAYAGVIGTGANYPLQFAVNNITRGGFSTSGNLLLGFTTDSYFLKLQVNGSIFSNNQFFGQGANAQLSIDSSTNISPLYVSAHSLTGTSAQAMLYSNTTWNTTGNPSLLDLNVTNTASGATSNYIKITDGTNTFRVTKAAEVVTAAPSGGSIKPWKLGEAATVSPTSPNRTIRVEIDGVVYYLHAKTTND